MKVVSVNVGLPRMVEYMHEPLVTGIFKSAVAGKVGVGPLNLDGDRQADLRVHGGPMKSVYVYPFEHYEYWRGELPAPPASLDDLPPRHPDQKHRDATPPIQEGSLFELPMGVFGENLTTEGILETEVRRGDRLAIGTAEFEVTIPRYPCFKLGIRFGRKDMLRRFAKSGRCGFYLSVLKTGELEAGDEIRYEATGSGPTISEVFAERMNRSSE